MNDEPLKIQCDCKLRLYPDGRLWIFLPSDKVKDHKTTEVRVFRATPEDWTKLK